MARRKKSRRRNSSRRGKADAGSLLAIGTFIALPVILAGSLMFAAKRHQLTAAK